MYERPELHQAHARYWDLIHRALSARAIPSPQELTQDADEFDTWLDPGLVLSQTCGMPYRTTLHGRVTLVGTPDFGLDGCEPGHYRSALVVRATDAGERVEDFVDRVFAYNQNHSQSGFTAPYRHAADRGFWFEKRLHAGQHLKSAQSVANGDADIAAIDAVTWRLIEQHEPFARQLRVVEWTEPTPGLPYITALGVDEVAVFGAVQSAIAELQPDDRHALGLRGLVSIAEADYLQIENPPQAITDAL